ncbi:MAG: TolC family protein [bacterium]
MTPHHHKRAFRTASTLFGIILFSFALCVKQSHASPPQATNISTDSMTRRFSIGEQCSSFEATRVYDLPALVELSLANNPYTRSAWFKALAAKASAGQAKAPYYPIVKLNATGGYSQQPYPTQSGPLTVNSVSISPGLELEYLLLDFGRRSADVKRTVALLAEADLEFNRREQSTVYAVQQSYFAHTAALTQQEAAQANLSLSQIICDMVKAKVTSGLATQPELLASQKTLSQAEYDLASARRNVEVTLGNLRVATGLEANAPIKIAPPSGVVAVESLPCKVDRLIDTALQKRPDLAARMADVRASRAATERAKADFMPKLSLQGTYNSYSFGFYAKQASTAGTYFGNYNQAGGFAVLSWDLFDGFERVEKVKKRQAEESEARADAEASRLETTRDVWTAYNDSLKSAKKVSYAASLLLSVRENFDATQSAFQNGLATITELSAAQSTLAEARFESAGAESDYLTSLAALSLAMGDNGPNAVKQYHPRGDRTAVP